MWGVKVPYFVLNWNSCCSKITNPVCVTANTACQGLRATAYSALNVAKGVVSTASHSLAIANAALQAAKIPFDLANAGLTAAEKTYALGARAAAEIVSLGKTGIVNIAKISFDVQISVVSGGQFGGSITAGFFGSTPQTFSFSLDFKNVGTMIANLAKKALSTLQSGRKREAVPAESLGVESFMPVFEELENVHRFGIFEVSLHFVA